MNTTHVQKPPTIQKTANSKAASVFDSSTQSESLQRKADMANNAAQRAEAPRPNNTGMPDNLKAGIESLSGFSMDDVRVHYNSSKPATVQALAYTQGTDIHVAPGQEKHLPHEAWHVAQQMAGRVSPTTSINGMPVNDNAEFEHEADVMGEKAVREKHPVQLKKSENLTKNTTQLKLERNKLNVVGEHHPISNDRRDEEIALAKKLTLDYWNEYDFNYSASSQTIYGDPRDLRYKQNFFDFQCFMNALFVYFDAYKIDEEDPNFSKGFDDNLAYAQTSLEQMNIMLSSHPFPPKKNDLLLGGQGCLIDLINRINTSLKDNKTKNSDSLREEYNDYKRTILHTLGYRNIFGITKEFNNPEERTKESTNISEQRSKKMHKAAQKNSRLSGVWKIGERHRKYIENNFKNRDYNLVSAKQFDADINGEPANDNARLEQEANVMGEKAVREMYPTQLKKSEKLTKNTVQLELKRDVLNVVGENHIESDQAEQQRLEKKYVKNTIGTDFFKNEYEFKIDNDIPADSPELIFATRVLLLKESTNDFPLIVEQIESFVNNGINTTNDQTIIFLDNAMELLKGAYGHLAQMGTVEGQLCRRDKTLSKSIEDIKNAFKYVYKLLYEMKDFFISQEPMNFTQIPREAYSYKFRLTATKIQCMPILIEPVVNKYSLGYQDRDSIRKDRSAIMHQAANSQYDQHGVWKIGNKHVTDIKAKFPEEERKYNLISKVEFYDEMAKAGLFPDSRIDSYKKILKLREQKKLMPNDREKLLTEIRSVKKTE